MLEVRDLEVVEAITTHGSFARAARVLGVSQPALTRYVAALESRLRGVLFVRRNHGVEETDLCRVLKADAGDLLLMRPHILHAHSPLLNALPAQWVGRRLGIPVVYELRALWEDAAVDHGTTVEGSLRYRASRWLDTIALRRADHVTTICEGLRGEIASRGIPASKITVIPNAVDPETFHTDGQRDPDLARRLGLEDCAVLGFAGSFYAYEGLDLLVDALGKLLTRRPKVKLLLVGGGFQEAALKGQVQSLGLENHVIFTGRVPHDQVQRYYDLVDVLAYPRHSMRLTELVTPKTGIDE